MAWVHGCIGLYFWLRMKAFFKNAAPFLLAAVLIPTLAMLGLYQGGRTVVERQRLEGMARKISAGKRLERRLSRHVLDQIPIIS